MFLDRFVEDADVTVEHASGEHAPPGLTKYGQLLEGRLDPSSFRDVNPDELCLPTQLRDQNAGGHAGFNVRQAVRTLGLTDVAAQDRGSICCQTKRYRAPDARSSAAHQDASALEAGRHRNI